MKTLLARHSIQRTVAPGKAGDKNAGIAPIPPQVQSIKAGTLFVATNETEEEYLLKSRAAVVAPKGSADAKTVLQPLSSETETAAVEAATELALKKAEEERIAKINEAAARNAENARISKEKAEADAEKAKEKAAAEAEKAKEKAAAEAEKAKEKAAAEKAKAAADAKKNKDDGADLV